MVPLKNIFALFDNLKWNMAFDGKQTKIFLWNLIAMDYIF